MNYSLVVILLVALATMQIEAFAPSALRPSAVLRSIRTRLQFKNFDEMLEQLDVPVLVDFYGTLLSACSDYRGRIRLADK